MSDTGSITVHAEAEESTSTVTGTGTYYYPYSERIQINITAQDGTHTDYHVLYMARAGELTWERVGDVLTVRGDGVLSDGIDWGFDPGEIKTLFIEEGATALERYSFSMFMGLEYVSFPSSLNTFFRNSLYYSGLREVVLPNNIEYFEMALQDNFWLDHIQLPLNFEGKIANYFLRRDRNEYEYRDDLLRFINPGAIPYEGLSISDIDLSKATLYVPSSSIDAYIASPTWSRFKSVKSIPLLESFNVYDNDSELSFTPSFDPYVFNYYLTVPNNIQSIAVSATGATSGTGTHNLSEGYNLLRIIADDVTLYYLTVKREKAGGSAGIKNISAGKGEYVIYSADGRRLPRIEKGKVNILKYKNGKVKKILIK